MVEINIFELKNVKVTKFESGSAKVRLTQLNGGEVDIWFYNNDFEKVCEAIEETGAKVDISEKTELQKDMLELAKLTYELCKKHGNISEEYWPEENKKKLQKQLT